MDPQQKVDIYKAAKQAARDAMNIQDAEGGIVSEADLDRALDAMVEQIASSGTLWQQLKNTSFEQLVKMVTGQDQPEPHNAAQLHQAFINCIEAAVQGALTNIEFVVDDDGTISMEDAEGVEEDDDEVPV